MRSPLLCAVALAAAASACVDATVIGGEQFETDRLPVTFSDTVAFTLTTQRAEVTTLASALTDVGGPGAVYVGCFASGLTGATSATLGLELVEASNTRLNLDSATIDSAVLVLPLATALSLGDTTAEVRLRVEAAAAGTIGREEATLADSLASAGTVYGRYAGVPPRERVTVNTFANDSVRVDTVAAQLRIPLGADFLADVDAALRPRISADTSRDDEAFVEAFPGLLIRGDGCGSQLPALGFGAADAAQFGVTLYYRDGGGTARQYRLVNRRPNSQGTALVRDVAQARVAYGHDYGGSTADTLLDGREAAGADAVVEGLQGLTVAVGFPDVATFGRRRGVTFAELLLPVAPDAPTAAEPFARLVLQVRNPSGDLVPYTAVPGATGFSPLEGGALEQIVDPRGGTDSIPAYRFNITSLFQEFVSGERDPVVFITPGSLAFSAGSAALVGPGTQPLRARLRVASAELP